MVVVSSTYVIIGPEMVSWYGSVFVGEESAVVEESVIVGVGDMVSNVKSG